MERKLHDLYTELVQKVNDMTPVDWKKIYFHAKVTKENE